MVLPPRVCRQATAGDDALKIRDLQNLREEIKVSQNEEAEDHDPGEYKIDPAHFLGLNFQTTEIACFGSGRVGLGLLCLGESKTQMLDQFVVGLIPLVRHLRHHAIDDIRGLVADIGSEGLEADGAAFELLQGHERGVVGLVGWTACHGMKESAAEAVNITSEILR